MIDEGGAGRVRWFRDWRVWLGVGITVACIWYSMRGVPIADVREAMARADLLLLIALSVPGLVGSVYFRALRWRHLTNPLAPIPRATLFRAVSIGFLINNIMPLRLGEIVRSWYLGRESRISATSVLGTVALERVLDIASVLLIAAGALVWVGAEIEGGGLLARGALLLLPAGLAPLAVLIVLRVAPERVIRFFGILSRPFPDRVGRFLEVSLRSFSDGLGALSGGSHLFWLVFHSIIIWLVMSTLPVIAGLIAFGVDLGSPERMLVTSWIVLAAVGVAVAIPSAPGFFGPYQLACKAVLVRFGVDEASALALGLLVWFVFWTTLIALGLLVLRGRTSLAELAQQSSKDPTANRR